MAAAFLLLTVRAYLQGSQSLPLTTEVVGRSQIPPLNSSRDPRRLRSCMGKIRRISP